MIWCHVTTSCICEIFSQKNKISFTAFENINVDYQKTVNSPFKLVMSWSNKNKTVSSNKNKHLNLTVLNDKFGKSKVTAVPLHTC